MGGYEIRGLWRLKSMELLCERFGFTPISTKIVNIFRAFFPFSIVDEKRFLYVKKKKK